MNAHRRLPRPPARTATEHEADWRTRAMCQDTPDAMFPANDTKKIQAAKRICARCTVALECLASTLRTEAGLGRRDDVWGIAGGLRPYERWRLIERGVTPEQILAARDRQAAA